MNKSIDVYSCGTYVAIKINGVKAMITAVSIRYSHIIYEITYYTNDEFKTVWMRDEEFEIKNDYGKTNIGFKI
jgi:hypothetical protein